MGERKLNVGLPLVARRTVWVYKAFWAKIETKPQKKIHTRLKQSFFFFLFIYLLLLLLFCYYYYLDKAKNQRENLFFFYYFFLPFSEKKTNYYYLFYYLFSRTKLGVDSINLRLH